MELLYIILGILAGIIPTWLIVKFKYEKEIGIPREEMDYHYVKREFYEDLKQRFLDKENELHEVSTQFTRLQEQKKYLENRLDEHKSEIEDLQGKFKSEFRNLAHEIMEEKSKKFVEINEDKLSNILNPLKDRIRDFEKKVHETYEKETREKVSLRKELEYLVKLNQQVSEDASRLTKALKGDAKIQGDWGEAQLEMILEKAGLQKNIHYQKQSSFKDDTGKIQRPDYIINLPENKQLILDSKVSLTAYEAYFNAEDENDRGKYLKDHLVSINRHIQDLGVKNYQKLYDIHSPDYILMFVPLEGALHLALKEDTRLFEKALDKNVVLVSVSTLMATLRTITFMWKQENQRQNVDEIARQSGALYDKFVGFLKDLEEVGKKLDDAKSSYSDALNKLVKSTRKGDTIVGRMEKLKELGADTHKSIPGNFKSMLND